MKPSNQEFLKSAAREGNPLCIHCERNPVRDESEAVFARYTTHGGKYRHAGEICFECAAGIFEEELDEFTEELQALLGPVFIPNHERKAA
jgi:hypothetical protein